MPKHVIVVATGETERRALPHLVSHLREQDISVDEVRIPNRNRTLDPRMAEQIIKAVWYEKADASPDKIILLVDVDGASPDEVLAPFTELSRRLNEEIAATVQYAYAQHHLEAWYFADAENLKKFIGRSPGNVDTSKPDEIRNPKGHLKNLLGDHLYTARFSGEIASKLDARTIAQRSPSFKGFLDAVRNGSRHAAG